MQCRLPGYDVGFSFGLIIADWQLSKVLIRFGWARWFTGSRNRFRRQILQTISPFRETAKCKLSGWYDVGSKRRSWVYFIFFFISLMSNVTFCESERSRIYLLLSRIFLATCERTSITIKSQLVFFSHTIYKTRFESPGVSNFNGSRTANEICCAGWLGYRVILIARFICLSFAPSVIGYLWSPKPDVLRI